LLPRWSPNVFAPLREFQAAVRGPIAVYAVPCGSDFVAGEPFNQPIEGASELDQPSERSTARHARP
jgi:hypothetical protein